MALLENEKEMDSLWDSLDNKVLLTNYRIVKEHGDLNFSISLEKISSTSIKRKINRISLFLFGIGCLGGGFFIFDILGAFFIAIGVFLIIASFFKQKHKIIISHEGGKDLEIEIEKNTSEVRVEDFLANIQKAKKAMIESRQKSQQSQEETLKKLLQEKDNNKSIPS